MYSLDKKIEEMNKSGVDRQLISLAMPGVDGLGDKAVEAAVKVNDEIANVVEQFNGRFIGAATVPLSNPSAAVEELKRATGELGLRAVEIFSNVSGKPLDDERFRIFFEKAADLKVPVLLHPAKPLMADVMREYALNSVVGFLFDTTLAILRLIFSGLLEEFPSLRIVLPHMGSTIPYLIGRIDHQYGLNPECRIKIKKVPSEYFKSIYFDTAQSLYLPAVRCAYDFAGAERILFGTDHPFADLKKSLEIIKTLNLTEDDEEKIFSGNARALLKL